MARITELLFRAHQELTHSVQFDIAEEIVHSIQDYVPVSAALADASAQS